VGISHEIIRKLIDNKNPKHRNINNAEIKRAERVKAIETDPSIIINGREYGSLTREQQAKWIYSHGDGSQWDHTDYYKKRTPNNNKRNLEKTLEWRITHDPTAIINGREYGSLTREQQAKWIYSHGDGPQWDHTDYYKKRTPNNNKRNLEKTLEWRITHDPTATITIKEYQSLTPEQQTKFDYVNMIDQSSGKKIASNSYYKRKMPAAPALAAPAPANWDPFAGGKRKTRKLRNKLKK